MPGSSTLEHIAALITDLNSSLQAIGSSDLVSPQDRDAFQQQTLTATAALESLTSMFHNPPMSVVPRISASHRAPATSIRAPTPTFNVPTLPEGALVQRPTLTTTTLPEGAQLQRVSALPSAPPTPPAAPLPTPPPTPPPATPPGPAPDTPAVQRVVLSEPADPPADLHVSQSSDGPPNTRLPSSRGRTQPQVCTLQSLPQALLNASCHGDGIIGAQQRRRARRRRRVPHQAAFLGHSPPLDVATLNLDGDGNPLKWSTALKGPDKDAWINADAEEFIRLLDTTSTMRPILPRDQPADRRKDTTYYNRVVKIKVKNGVRDFRVRGTVGGDRIHYDGDVAAHTAEMSTVKILLQSVVSDDASFMTLDIKDFYLNTPLTRPEYIRIQASSIPDSIMDRFALLPYVHNGAVLFEITKGMYGLPQAGLLAQQRLVAHLSASGFVSCPNTPCLFRHVTRAIAFTLVVDDFGVKYTDKDDVEYLISTLTQLYQLTINWKGDKYLGFTINHDKSARRLSLSMPNYIPTALERFGHLITHGAASPAIYTPPSYGSTTPQLTAVDDSAPLSPADAKLLQEIVGVFLYYARAVDGTMLPAVTAIASDQAKPTQAVLSAATRLLAYAASYPANELVFSACDMVLYGQSDASYLSRSDSRSVAGGIFYLGNRDAPTQVNGAIDAFSSIIRVVVSSAAEAEYGGLFIAAQHATCLRSTLADLGYPQDATLLLCDNACAVGIASDTVKSKRSKTIDMRFHWVRDRVRQGQFVVQWRKGAHNLADFFTKPLPVKVHQSLMSLLVNVPPRLDNPHITPRHRRAVAHQRTHPRSSRHPVSTATPGAASYSTTVSPTIAAAA